MAGPKSLGQLLRASMQARLATLRTAMPAEVVSYDPATQTAAVQPLIKEVRQDAETATEVVEALPQIKNVPVMFPRSGEYFVSLPIKKGDTVLLVVCERSIGRWRAQNKSVDPGVVDMHRLSDAVAIPGLFADAKSLPDVHADNLVMGKSEGAQIHVKADEVHLYEENAADFVALAQAANDSLTALKTDVDNLRTALGVWAPVPSDGGAALKTAIAAWLSATIVLTDVAAEKVKAT